MGRRRKPRGCAVETADRRSRTKRCLTRSGRTSLDAGLDRRAICPSTGTAHAAYQRQTDWRFLICLIDYWWAPDDLPWPSKKALGGPP